MAFRFKQFSVEDDRSTMRVGTDAVLLGAWASPRPAHTILDTGTGCGVISLMLAQQSDAGIDAIELDKESAIQAKYNFEQSPWNTRLNIFHSSLQDFTRTCNKRYDLILTNPPFFRNSLKSPDPLRNLARHSVSLTPQELLDCVKKLLTDQGRFLLILPGTEGQKFSILAEESGMFIQKQLNIRPKPGKPVNRGLFSYGLQLKGKPETTELTLRKNDKEYTTEYLELTAPYYFRPG